MIPETPADNNPFMVRQGTTTRHSYVYSNSGRVVWAVPDSAIFGKADGGSQRIPKLGKGATRGKKGRGAKKEYKKGLLSQRRVAFAAYITCLSS